MKEELTNKILESMTKCSELTCISCLAYNIVCCNSFKTVEMLARKLLEERAEPKVWEFAPITAERVVVYYYVEGAFFGEKTYTRELPKTRAGQIAEEIGEALSSSDRYKPEVKIIEAVLEKYAEELEGKHAKNK